MREEGEALELMKTGATRCEQSMYQQGKINGIISLWGSMVTTLGTGVMRRFPVGFPKVMISPMASRNTRALQKKQLQAFLPMFLENLHGILGMAGEADIWYIP
jgi:uncharacterized protein (UPF0261 family)